jgi:hypothetical protein
MSMRYLLLAATAFGLLSNFACAADWIFDHGQYTNDKKTGKRVEQYKKAKTPTLVPYDKYFSKDGPGTYIPYSFYQEELGLTEGLYGGFGSIGNGIAGGGNVVPGPYGGPVAF